MEARLYTLQYVG